MKICSKCLIEKDEKEFFWKDKKAGRLHAQCKLCYREHRKSYAAEHYSRYADQYRARAKERRIKIRRELQRNLLEYLREKSCAECGEFDIRVLEFDHIEPKTKNFGIAEAIRNGMKWRDILVELEMCQILCANCHKKRTAAQYGWFKALNIER